MDNLIHADCLDAMAAMDAESIDAIVTDPPYGLEFMGKAWDKLWDKRRADTFKHGEMSSIRNKPTYEGGARAQQWHEAWAREAFRIAKPGAHLLAFGGTRTVHRLAAAIEDAGWEIRDMLVWGYASGFPKSLDVSKAIDRARDDRDDILTVTAFLRSARDAAQSSNEAIDKHFGTAGMAGHWTSSKSQPAVPKWEQWIGLKLLLGFGDAMDAEVWRLNGRKGTPGEAWSQREVVGRSENGIAGGTGRHTGNDKSYGFGGEFDLTAPATPDAEKWNGWGTALKPAWEPIVMARKPLRGTVAANVLRHGTGALNIDGTRIGVTAADAAAMERANTPGSGRFHASTGTSYGRPTPSGPLDTTAGRWPANVILTDPIFDGGVEGVVGGGETGQRVDWIIRKGSDSAFFGGGSEEADGVVGYGDSGTYSRFFLIAKSARAEREPVLGGLATTAYAAGSAMKRCAICGKQEVNNPGSECQCDEPQWVRPEVRQRANVHPTVKPLDLMRHLVRLVTPPGGTVLDPFLGSGTTALAAEMEGFAWIGIEKEAEYIAIIEARLNGTQRGLGLGA